MRPSCRYLVTLSATHCTSQLIAPYYWERCHQVDAPLLTNVHQDFWHYIFVLVNFTVRHYRTLPLSHSSDALAEPDVLLTLGSRHSSNKVTMQRQLFRRSLMLGLLSLGGPQCPPSHPPHKFQHSMLPSPVALEYTFAVRLPLRFLLAES